MSPNKDQDIKRELIEALENISYHSEYEVGGKYAATGAYLEKLIAKAKVA